jgi:hypothetical protein
MEKSPNRVIYNSETKRLQYTYDPDCEDEVKKLGNLRMNICFSCEHIFEKNGIKACKKCGCGLSQKMYRKYPLDENGKAYSQILPDGLRYVCPLKKW